MKVTPRTYFNIAILIFFAVIVFIAFDDGDTTQNLSGDTVVTDTLATPGFARQEFNLVRDVKPGSVKNVILMIGDGMGLTQITAGYYGNGKSLAMKRCMVIGLITTHSATSILTDSAAGATTFATGRKTRNGMISMTPDTVAVKTLMEYAEEQSLSTGLVVTSTITHATPACFFGHQPKRNSVNERLISQLYELDLEVVMGGGKSYFSDRVDQRDMLAEFQAKGYDIVDSIEETEGKEYNRLLCLMADAQPLGLTEGRKRGYLPQGTAKALDILKHNPNGFFLMVEGSQIDWGGHNNDSDYIVEEMKEFSDAVDVALDFAEQDGQTLVVITADHETGGYAINDGIMKDSIVRGFFTTDYHTAAMVPVFAHGPSAESFAGMYDNTDIFYKIMHVLGLEEDAKHKAESIANGKYADAIK